MRTFLLGLFLGVIFSSDFGINIISVGQGDCSLITCPNGNNILIDCGGKSGPKKEEVRKYIMKQSGPGDFKIVITHCDDDHANFISTIFDSSSAKKRVKGVYLSGNKSDYKKNNRMYISDFLDQVPVKEVNEGKECIGNCYAGFEDFCPEVSIKVVAANLGSKLCRHKEDNVDSIITRIQYKGLSMLFPGDFENCKQKKNRGDETAYNYLINNSGGSLEVSDLHVPHHGASRLANKEEFIKAVLPRKGRAYISSAFPPGTHGHPNCKAKRILESYVKTGVTPHPFACSEGKGKVAKLDDSYDYAIYSTVPEAGIPKNYRLFVEEERDDDDDGDDYYTDDDDDDYYTDDDPDYVYYDDDVSLIGDEEQEQTKKKKRRRRRKKIKKEKGMEIIPGKPFVDENETQNNKNSDVVPVMILLLLLLFLIIVMFVFKFFFKK